MAYLYFTLIILMEATLGRGLYPPPKPQSYHRRKFIPAMPGETPACLKNPRLTFCDKLERYPDDQILFLVKNRMFDIETFFRDESFNSYTFQVREHIPKPKKPMKYNYNHDPYQNSIRHQSNPLLNFSTNSFQSPQNIGLSYMKPPPPRTYQQYPVKKSFNTSSAHAYNSINSQLVVPPVFNYNLRSNDFHRRNYKKWWRRNHKRTKRQAEGAGSQLCPSTSSYIMPKAAQRVDGEWKFVVNVDTQITQLVKSETCNQNTCEGACNVPDGFTAICEQQYAQKKLVSLDDSGTKLNSDLFWFPSCCVCKITPNTG